MGAKKEAQWAEHNAQHAGDLGSVPDTTWPSENCLEQEQSTESRAASENLHTKKNVKRSVRGGVKELGMEGCMVEAASRVSGEKREPWKEGERESRGRAQRGAHVHLAC